MYSNLEVNPWQSDPGKEVVQDNGKQLSMNNGEIEPVAIEPVGIELVEKQNIFARDNLRQRLKWREIALILAFGSMIILAIVGGVIASQKRHSTQSWVPNVNVPQLRNIAALSFASNSINMTRVYFQDDEGQIVEAANSHVANDSGWNMAVLGFGAKNWSALAAAVSRPGFPLEISVFYLDKEDVIHDLIYNSSLNKWNSGLISNYNYKALSNSKITATYYQCRFCANATLIAFQDENGFVQIGNFTSAGWTLSQLGPALDPAMSTGLALIQYSDTSLHDHLNLFHQKSNLNMSVAWWRPDIVDGWNLNEIIYDTVPTNGSYIAAASSYSKAVGTTGYPIWVERLSISNRGIQTGAKSGALNKWIQQGANPSVMANSTANPRIYGGVAVTAIGSAFGVVSEQGQVDKIRNWQVEDDTMNWKLVGDLDLGGSWKTSAFEPLLPF